MAAKAMLTGMCGVYLAAAELSRRGFLVTPTARSAKAADLLVADQGCQRAYSVQVKTNASTFGHFLLGADSGEARSLSHVYIFINLRDRDRLWSDTTEFYVVPSLKMGNVQWARTKTGGRLHGVKLGELKPFRDSWEAAFGTPVQSLPAAATRPTGRASKRGAADAH